MNTNMTPDDLRALAKRHMGVLCDLLAHTPETRKELMASLDLMFEMGKTAGALEQTARTRKALTAAPVN